MKPGYKSLRKGRTSIHNQIYHLRASTAERKTHFENFVLARSFIQLIHKPTIQSKTLCFVVMPDHFHWLIQFDQRDKSLSALIRRIKAQLTLKAQKEIGLSNIWQSGFYDRAIRSEEDIKTIAQYIVANPIRAKLVRRIGDYPHWDTIWLE